MSTEAKTVTVMACRSCGKTLIENGIGGGCEGLSIGEVVRLLPLIGSDAETRRKARADSAHVIEKLRRIAACGPPDAPIGRPVIFCRNCRSNIGEWGDFRHYAILISPGLAGRLLHFTTPRRGRSSGDEINERDRQFMDLLNALLCAFGIHQDSAWRSGDETAACATDRLS